MSDNRTPARVPARSRGDAFNIASHLPRVARDMPDRPAVVVHIGRDEKGGAVYRSRSIAELETLSNRYADGLTGAGFGRGMRVLLMVRPGFDFIALVFALFKIGAVPVMIDPGMGVGRMLECIRMVDLQGFIGIPAAQVMRVLRRGVFRSVRHVVTVGRRWAWGGTSLRRIAHGASEHFETVATAPTDTAAILFTSGSTGPAKGVVYEHAMFDAQIRAIQGSYGIKPGEIDLPAFPLFALFSVAMGMTSVIPQMDPSRPATVDPAKIVEAIIDHQVTNSFGSPAIWRRVADYCVERHIRLPSLNRILIAGAPVPYPVIEKLHAVLREDADVHTPYGATEALPVSSISGREIVGPLSERSRSGGGICIGKPLDGIELRIIRIADEPVAQWSDELCAADGQIGEIVATGEVVTKSYYGLAVATGRAKIQDGDRIRHRMGDVGYRDCLGRIWFCGRMAHRVVTERGTMYSVCCEAVYNEHPQVSRCALVGLDRPPRQRPVIVVERRQDAVAGASTTQDELRRELLALGRANPLTVTIDDVLFHPDLPVDVRHNAKINREALAVWAAKRVR